MNPTDVLDADDRVPPCIGERFRDMAVDLALPDTTGRVISLGAARLRRDADGSHDEQLVIDALVACATRRNATAREIDAARVAALVELRQGRSVAWAIQCGQCHLPLARNRARLTPRPPSAS